MKNKLLVLILISIPIAAFSAHFTPYESDDESFNYTEAFISLANWRNEDGTSSADDYYAHVADHSKECGTCAGLDEDALDDCLSSIYDAGVVPHYDTDGTTVLYYEFPGCTDSSCPLHHQGGWCADEDGQITDVTRAPDSVLDPDEYPDKPKLPVGEPFVMTLFALVYAFVRNKKSK
ncbi:MAG: hypothetical protein PUG15_06655 [Bacteroidales bacterium]|nr:hypothetical protein [Bacteroidales bacterium]